eukprot:9273755-Alexandrium_andersonii.AAC.1
MTPRRTESVASSRSRSSYGDRAGAWARREESPKRELSNRSEPSLPDKRARTGGSSTDEPEARQPRAAKSMKNGAASSSSDGGPLASGA